MSRKIRIAVWLSGSGTTLQNLLDQINKQQLAGEIVSVVSSKPDVFGLVRAQSAGIANKVVDRKKFENVGSFSKSLFDDCRHHKADLVVLAGFLNLIEVPPDYTNRVMNIHPSLIPAFCGKGYHGQRVHQAAIDAGVKISGCTVHYADNEYDHGPIILQKAVPVADNDTATTLAARVFEAECQIYPEAINLHAQGRLLVQGKRVTLKH